MTKIAEVVTGLANALVTEAPIDLLTYQRDCSVIRPGHAQAMVRPTRRDAVVTLMQRAEAARVPVYVRGGGTMYAGGVNPQAGGVVLDLSGLDRILEIDLVRGVVVVEPGVRFGALAKALRPHGMTIGIIPVTGPTATIGGAASAHALGTGSACHQSFADEVVGLEVVLAGGRVIRTGSAAAPDAGFFQRYCIGPDLTGLFLGGDATFGVITAVALWLHPLPAFRETVCYGFPSPVAASAFITDLQTRELTRNIWYGSGYEAPSIKARVLAAYPTTDPTSLPQFCVGLDYGGDEHSVRHDQETIDSLCREHAGALAPVFNEVYFRRLRNEDLYWYGFAGYFARSRCAILMTSLPTTRLSAFLGVIDQQRQTQAGFTWGGAVVICKRGLHGGIMAFYDEATQWAAAEAAADTAADALIAAGCVPYKSGKIWARQVQSFSAYHEILNQLKTCLDPQGILSPGNLGL